MNKKNVIDTEKFLMLAIKAAKANGIVVEEEKELLRRYSRSTMYHDDADTTDFDVSLDTLTAYFETLSLSQKKRILFEILNVMYSDHLFDEPECNFVYDLAGRIGVDESELSRILSICSNGYAQKHNAVAC
ncbi:MAG: hypothetical protein IJM34_02595 [Lachnospiraceae bacterium]|nr:hypothetical protein [Lachnospiraceae bacterium]